MFLGMFLRMFHLIFFSGDAELSPQELRYGVKKVLGIKLERTEIDAVFQTYDPMGRGLIHLSEFCLAVEDHVHGKRGEVAVKKVLRTMCMYLSPRLNTSLHLIW